MPFCVTVASNCWNNSNCAALTMTKTHIGSRRQSEHTHQQHQKMKPWSPPPPLPPPYQPTINPKLHTATILYVWFFWLKVSSRVTVHSILFWKQTECKAQSQNVLNLSAWPLAFNCGENCQRSLTIAIRGERKKENTRKKSCTYVCTLLPYNYMNTLYKLPLGRF